ncbi:LDCC motif putative metal-binding protein [Alkalibaculum sporogenes]|nr:LDCC motif putative metal-binding protein [Alkalibaculum sporogenes]
MFKFIDKWLKNLAEQNKKSFGTSKLDCCELNKTKKTNKVKNKS